MAGQGRRALRQRQGLGSLSSGERGRPGPRQRGWKQRLKPHPPTAPTRATVGARGPSWLGHLLLRRPLPTPHSLGLAPFPLLTLPLLCLTPFSELALPFPNADPNQRPQLAAASPPSPGLAAAPRCLRPSPTSRGMSLLFRHAAQDGLPHSLPRDCPQPSPPLCTGPALPMSERVPSPAARARPSADPPSQGPGAHRTAPLTRCSGDV